MSRLLALLAALLLCACQSGEAGASAAVPELTGRVIDQAGLLTEAEMATLAARLERLERETTDQVVIVTLADLGGESIEQVGLRLGNQWGIGRDDLDNGVLLIIAPQERTTRIEVGLGLEGLVTNERAAGILREDMLPRFGEGAWYQGLSAAVASIETMLRSNRHRPIPASWKQAA